MIVEFATAFDRNYSKLPSILQMAARETVGSFLEHYAAHSYPKGLRVHKCGEFLSLTVTMSYRIFVSPIPGGIKFVFIGNHQDADNFLKK